MDHLGVGLNITGHLHSVVYESNLCMGQAQPKKISLNCLPETTLILTEILRDTIALSPVLPCFARDHNKCPVSEFLQSVLELPAKEWG